MFGLSIRIKPGRSPTGHLSILDKSSRKRRLPLVSDDRPSAIRMVGGIPNQNNPPSKRIANIHRHIQIFLSDGISRKHLRCVLHALLGSKVNAILGRSDDKFQRFLRN